MHDRIPRPIDIDVETLTDSDEMSRSRVQAELGERALLADGEERCPVPGELEGAVAELIADRLLSEPPILSQSQWDNISSLADLFAMNGPNPEAKRVWQKLAIFHMIHDAQKAIQILN